jgi:phage-related minor tail protein
MAKRKKGPKVQKRAKLRRASSAKRGKARKAAQAKTVTKAKRAPVKKAARKVQQPVAPVVETIAVEVIEQPVSVTEVEQTEIRKAS